MFRPITKEEIQAALDGARAKGGLTIKDLAEAVGVKYSRARKIVLQCLDAGDLRESRSEQDKRVKIFTAVSS